MKINTSFSTNDVTGPTTSKPAVKAGAPATSSVSLEGSSALEAALGAVPDVRPEAVSQAKQLINDPSYPSQAVIKQLANFFAQNLSSTQA